MKTVKKLLDVGMENNISKNWDVYYPFLHSTIVSYCIITYVYICIHVRTCTVYSAMQEWVVQTFLLFFHPYIKIKFLLLEEL